jgi:hypothetical protein
MMTNDLNHNDDLVTIAELDSQAEFLIIRSLLESADIECSSPDFNEYHVKGRNPSYTVIRVQVHASDADDAVTLLKDAESHPGSEEPHGDPQP